MAQLIGMGVNSYPFGNENASLMAARLFRIRAGTGWYGIAGNAISVSGRIRDWRAGRSRPAARATRARYGWHRRRRDDVFVRTGMSAQVLSDDRAARVNAAVQRAAARANMVE
ncbi:hypothetical protein [Burkholderia sp. BE17]|uniref:hypothetical protein n=1 Tax=Burkholderia sp. BE17 TaxID=2656644 RepID=UPI00128E03AB|nr:hypothetical protein [Burkholderia sp. BE17]MPV68532.1 hypothetical protein [Burkholderia sp. BE17]